MWGRNVILKGMCNLLVVYCECSVIRTALISSNIKIFSCINFLNDQLKHCSGCNSEIRSVLDKLILAKTVTICRRSSDPWLDGECRQSKHELRCLERSPKDTGSHSHVVHQTLPVPRSRALLRRKCECFWQAKIEAEKSKPGQLWQSIDALLTLTLRSFIVSSMIKLLAYDRQHPTPRLHLFH